MRRRAPRRSPHQDAEPPHLVAQVGKMAGVMPKKDGAQPPHTRTSEARRHDDAREYSTMFEAGSVDETRAQPLAQRA